jgi:hypothetical protein
MSSQSMRIARERLIAVDTALTELRKNRVPEAEIQAALDKVLTRDEQYQLDELRKSVTSRGMSGAITGALLRGNANRGQTAIAKSAEHGGKGNLTQGGGTFRFPAPEKPVAKSREQMDADIDVNMDEHDAEKVTRMAKVRGDIGGKRTL